MISLFWLAIDFTVGFLLKEENQFRGVNNLLEFYTEQLETQGISLAIPQDVISSSRRRKLNWLKLKHKHWFQQTKLQGCRENKIH